MFRPKIAEFQSRLKGCILGHGTHRDHVPKILEQGLTEEYNYACIEQGWEMHGEHHANVQFPAESLVDRIYPDPEGQWGDGIISMKQAADERGLEAVLDELESCFNGKGWMEDFGDDVTDPANYNLVIVGPVPADLIMKEEN